MILCSMFSEGKEPFDIIKRYVIQKLAYKVKDNDQINGGLMFFRNSRVRFFKISLVDCEQYGKSRCKKKEHKHCSEFKVLS